MMRLVLQLARPCQLHNWHEARIGRGMFQRCQSWTHHHTILPPSSLRCACAGLLLLQLPRLRQHLKKALEQGTKFSGVGQAVSLHNAYLVRTWCSRRVATLSSINGLARMRCIASSPWGCACNSAIAARH